MFVTCVPLVFYKWVVAGDVYGSILEVAYIVVSCSATFGIQ